MTIQLVKPKKKLSRKPAPNGRSSTRAADIIINGSVHIPPCVTDHDSFRRWACSADFPDRGQFFYLDGELWADLSMETLIHNQIKAVFSMVVSSIAFGESLGRYLGDRMMLAHLAAGLSCEPDGMFISNATFDRERVFFEKGDESLEIIGSPDMALEIISKSSVEKDTVILKELYAKAGITEYWLVDSTIETPELEIYRLVSGKYVAARKTGGWAKSQVFARSFRLTCKKDTQGLSHFSLETK